MLIINELQQLKSEGYSSDNADARFCQDIILKALSQSQLSRNVTIKGGVVMRNISGNARRATQDLDLDFIRYSLADESIAQFVDLINTIDGITITIEGVPQKLKHQDYNGKRVYLRIADATGYAVVSSGG